jgi:hypothetical protein
VARELGQIDAATLSAGQQAALTRLRARAQREMRAGDIGISAALSGAVDSTQLRTFGDTPREEGEAALSADWLGSSFAWKLSATVVADPDEDHAFRPDGAYVAMSAGNWMPSAGCLDRWWGPGWEGSLIPSNNARPLPAIAIDCNEPTPFDLPGLRWSCPGRRVPLALYAPGIGEDEAGFMPSKYLDLFGAEVWGDVAGGSWRAHVEYADTACDFLNDPPEFGCAYTHGIYTSGYRHRGRVQGHSMDADGESIGVGLLFVEQAGQRWDLLARSLKINRAGVAPEHSLADAPTDVQDIVLTHERA